MPNQRKATQDGDVLIHPDYTHHLVPVFVMLRLGRRGSTASKHQVGKSCGRAQHGHKYKDAYTYVHPSSFERLGKTLHTPYHAVTRTITLVECGCFANQQICPQPVSRQWLTAHGKCIRTGTNACALLHSIDTKAQHPSVLSTALCHVHAAALHSLPTHPPEPSTMCP